MFTLVFWRATLERALSTAAQSALLVIGGDQFNVIDANFETIGGFAVGGFLLSVIKAVGAYSINPATGPSFGQERPISG